MFSVIILCGFCAFSVAVPQEAENPPLLHPAHGTAINLPPLPLERNGEAFVGNVTGDDGFSHPSTKSMTDDVLSDGNVTAGNETGNAVSDELWTSLLRRLLQNSNEAKNHKYPTATWTAEQHEKLKQYQKNRPKKMPKVFLMKPSALLKSAPSEKDRVPRRKVNPKSKRGKIKWKDSRQKPNQEVAYQRLGKEEIDRFLERSLLRYLISSNLIENIGNVSVETFSSILRNVTRQKADRRQFWPYDENKELRIKFRDEVFMKRKNGNSSRGRFLEKQLQRRLERTQDPYGSKGKDKVPRGRNAAQFATVAPDPTTVASTTEATTSFPSVADTEPTTEFFYGNATEPSVAAEEYHTENLQDIARSELEELKLSVAETVYYKKRPPTLHTLRVEEGETGVIPGIPHVDYPMYSSPPRTGFRCPDGIGDQPRMMADVQTRCQVFYVCTGDGPAAAMLCPNGTMFNENVRVCDWWYNVDC